MVIDTIEALVYNIAMFRLEDRTDNANKRYGRSVHVRPLAGGADSGGLSSPTTSRTSRASAALPSRIGPMKFDKIHQHLMEKNNG